MPSMCAVGRAGAAARRARAFEAVARAVDGEALFVEQFADAADQQHLVVLVVAPVAAALDRLELREFLFPVAQDVRLDRAQFADFADREIALGRNRMASCAALSRLPSRATPPGLDIARSFRDQWAEARPR
jgi:hypothetical protein